MNELGERIKNYDIISLTETKTNYKDKVKFSGFTVYRHDGLQTRTNGTGDHVIGKKITYKQKKDTWGSDHYPISYDIDEELEPYKKKSNKITSKKTDWIKYDELLMENLEEIQEMYRENSDHIELYEAVYDNMIKAALIATGKKADIASNDNDNEKDKKYFS
ncbi:hypothetical protein PV325_008306 [Microctonus aethiopoides]|nr:hypothetical protein PV325_008306 [Microctonus aethiopoides]KAK0079679.1 hypothetical protein PV326_008607 [Microctonus aethiopoides]